MTSAAKKILEHALGLPEEERRRVGEALLDSVPQGTPDQIQQAWVEEARRRAEAVETGEESLDLDEALAELRADLRRIHQG
jgi:hypothetical protein